MASLATSATTIVPNFHDETTDTAVMTFLKERLDGLKTLGLVQVSSEDYMVIYEGKYLSRVIGLESPMWKIEYGCYITQYGSPSRGCKYIKWETKAISYAYRDGHILLISPKFIEIRNVTTGRIVQVIEGDDIRLLSSGPHTSKDDPVLVAMRGGYQDQYSVSEKIVELNETEENVRSPRLEADDRWVECDM